MTTTQIAAAVGAPAWERRFGVALAGIAARAAEHDRDASFPHEAFATLHELGVPALTVPAGQGGAGAGLRVAADVVERVARADASVGLVLLWQLALHAEIARGDAPWPEDLRRAVQRSAVDEGALINALRVEPDLGTPARGGIPATVAARERDGGWRIGGRKTYCTGIPALRWLLVWCATDEDDVRTGAFLVERSAPGWSIVETWDHLGLRASGTHDVVLDGVVVPAGHAVDVRRPQQWREVDRSVGLAWVTTLMAAVYTGVAVAARDWLAAYLNERTPTNLGAPLASLHHFQLAAGRIESLLMVSHALIRDVAAGVDGGSPDAPARGPVAKHVATRNAVEAIDIALGLTGNPGLTRFNPLERHHRDALTGPVHTPQADMVLGELGRAALTGGDAVVRVHR
ncbi:MAG: acyl-CoA dehydrogenase family protein [Thermoleophilia bacterium]